MTDDLRLQPDAAIERLRSIGETDCADTLAALAYIVSCREPMTITPSQAKQDAAELIRELQSMTENRDFFQKEAYEQSQRADASERRQADLREKLEKKCEDYAAMNNICVKRSEERNEARAERDELRRQLEYERTKPDDASRTAASTLLSTKSAIETLRKAWKASADFARAFATDNPQTPEQWRAFGGVETLDAMIDELDPQHHDVFEPCELAKARARIMDVERERDELRKELEDANALVANIREQEESNHEYVVKYRTECSALRFERGSLRHEVSIADEQIERLKTARDAALSQVRELEGALRTIDVETSATFSPSAVNRTIETVNAIARAALASNPPAAVAPDQRDAEIARLREAFGSTVSTLSDWCEAVANDSSWDGWDHHYKEAKNNLPFWHHILSLSPAPVNGEQK